MRAGRLSSVKRGTDHAVSRTEKNGGIHVSTHRRIDVNCLTSGFWAHLFAACSCMAACIEVEGGRAHRVESE